MYSVSPAFLTALRQPSMTVAVSVTASDGTTLSVTDGSVTMDSRRNITRTAELQLTATGTLSASQVYDLVMTPGIELTIRRGLKLADGTTEYVSLGVFSTDDATISRSVAGGVRWTGSDRSKKIMRARFTDPYTIASATSLATAGTTLLTSRWSAVTTSFGNVPDTINAALAFEAGENSDPWDCARKMFADYGYDLNFDGLGQARAVSVPDPTTATAVFDFGSSSSNLVLSAETQGTFEGVYNGVIVTGEGSYLNNPVRAEAWDTNPASPTYYLGGYGKVPMFYSSPLITSNGDVYGVVGVDSRHGTHAAAKLGCRPAAFNSFG